MDKLTIKFPAALQVAAGGLFVLALITADTTAEADVFFLQGQDGIGEKGDTGDKGEKGDTGDKGDKGEKGDKGDAGEFTGTFTGDVTFTGNLTVNGITVDDLTVNASYDLPDCPEGYLKDESRTDIVLCKKGADEMVKVGNFWIDRYEASVWKNDDCSGTQYGETMSDDYPSSFPDTGHWTVPLYACSKTGVVPARMLTWFQAQQSCSLSGKDLCTNEEWQAAAAGTNDPGAYDGTAGGACHTDGAAARNTGEGAGTPGGSSSCVSKWGTEDMIGNLWEWTASWFSAGKTWQTSDGEAPSESPWPEGYGDDQTWNINGRAYNGSAYVDGLPASALRGGRWIDGAGAGVFAVLLTYGPSSRDSYYGFRCCRR